MKSTFLSLLILLPLAFDLCAQSDSSIVVFMNSQDILSSRYKDVKGSPYLFENFVLANIVSSNIDIYDNIAVNYNGHTKGFEARKGSKIIELDERWYLRVEIDPDINPGLAKDFGTEKLIFQRGIHPKLDQIFAIILYAGNQTVFAKTFQADLSSKKVEDVGKTREFKRFLPKFTYYLVKNGELETVNRGKKSFIKALGGGGELDTFIKENNIDLNSEKDLIKLVDFYDKNL